MAHSGVERKVTLEQSDASLWSKGQAHSGVKGHDSLWRKGMSQWLTQEQMDDFLLSRGMSHSGVEGKVTLEPRDVAHSGA